MPSTSSHTRWTARYRKRARLLTLGLTPFNLNPLFLRLMPTLLAASYFCLVLNWSRHPAGLLARLPGSFFPTLRNMEASALLAASEEHFWTTANAANAAGGWWMLRTRRQFKTKFWIAEISRPRTFLIRFADCRALCRPL